VSIVTMGERVRGYLGLSMDTLCLAAGFDVPLTGRVARRLRLCTQFASPVNPNCVVVSK
jgi:hypothetical protein